ncbi:unnamed protein product [Sphagnum troendelagicum]|uniref:Inositol polyphosphate-related phosphatase domain-containing protein n=1 Tax=Sphagnum troendelagicum TaxID=128251 RepID=A0ABP0TE37_9BRYO
MGNCVGRGDGGYCVLPHNCQKLIARYGHQLARGLLECQNSSKLLVFHKRNVAGAPSKSVTTYCSSTSTSNGVLVEPPPPPCWPGYSNSDLQQVNETKILEIDSNCAEVVVVNNKNVNKKGLSMTHAENQIKASDMGKVHRTPGDSGKFGNSASVRPRIRSGDLAVCVDELREILGAWSLEQLQQSVSDLNIYIVTWNMNGKAPLDNLANLVDATGVSHDFYVIGLQETPTFDVESAIADALGGNYCLVAAAVMMSLQLFVFAKRSLQQYISGARVDKVGVRGFSSVMGCQKGAAAVMLQFKGVSFLFITSHFSAHESNFDTRNAQYVRICQSVFARSSSGCSCVQPLAVTDELDCKMPGVASNLVEESDVVVWLGDLNYRVELPRSSVHFLINHKLQELWANDQLSRAVQSGQVFRDFEEGPLLFPPTYKYDIGTDNYDTSSKERVPSWTDRILYKVSSIKAELRCYDAISSVKTSDHRPVKALLGLKNLKESQL